MDDIKNIVNRVIGKISHKEPKEQKEIQDAWNNILDEKEIKHAKISGLKNDQLFVQVDSSAWLYQFNLKKKRIIKEIQVEFPEIKRIYFKLGKVR